MSTVATSRKLAGIGDFQLGQITVSPSTGRVLAGGEPVRVQALTMDVLVTLAQAQGATVTRDALIEACWQGRIVSDDAVARAIAKVRALEQCADPPPFKLETVPKIGYRLLAARYEGLGDTGPAPAEAEEPAPPPRTAPRRPAWRVQPAWLLAGAGGLAALAAVALLAFRPLPRSSGPTDFEDDGQFRAVHSTDFEDALLVLDENRLRIYLKNGWDPNWKLDSEGNEALHNLMMVCERNKNHDRAALVRVAGMLVAAGADPTARNKWNDTPLIIAQAKRYCGPGHPVVALLKNAISKRPAPR